MIKNKYKLILILLIMLLVPSNKVKAISNDLIYDVSGFNVNNGNMELSGFSFIDHTNNDRDKNLEIYIVAYTGTWVGDNNVLNKCKSNSSKCIFYKTNKTDQKINLFKTRCTSDACNEDGKPGSNYYNNASFNNVNTSCTSGSGGSHCIYYNVGFDVKINLENLFQQLNNKTIKFRVFNSIAHNGGKKYYSKDIAINPGVCGNGVKCSTKSNQITLNKKIMLSEDEETKIESGIEKTITTTSYIDRFTIGELTDEVYFTAVSASAKTYNSEKKVYENAGGSFRSYETYKIDTSKLVNGRSRNEVKLLKPTTNISYNSRVYALKAKKTGGEYYPCTKGKGCGTYYATVDWAAPTGMLTIKPETKTETEKKEKQHEEKCACFGGRCGENSCKTKKQDIKTCNSFDQTSVTCGNVTFSNEDCELTANASGKPIYYYYKVPYNKLLEILTNAEFKKTSIVKEHNNGNTIGNIYIGSQYNIKFYDITKNKVINEGKVFEQRIYQKNIEMYIPIRFKTNYKVYQKNSKITLNYKNEQTIKSGRFFEYSLNYTTTAGYQKIGRNTLWSENNWYSGNYGNVNKIKMKLTYTDGNHKEHQVDAYAYIDLDDRDDIYKYDEKNGKFEVVGKPSEIYNKVLENVDPIGNDLTLKTVFDNSNDYYNDNKKSNAGQFTCNIVPTNSDKTEMKADCNYVINKAYLNKITGNVVYPKEPDTETYRMATENKGSIYFIPYNMPTGKEFFFTIQSDNLSLINSMNYKYNAKCKVIAKNEIKDGPESKVTYRPIKNNDPFPSNKYTVPDTLSANWKEFFDKTKKLNRLNNLYQKQYISYQTNILTKDIIKKIKNYSDDNVYGDYNERGDINSNGKDKIITDNNNIFSITRGKHCEAGKFDDTCDEAQGSR